jgi:transcriptional regulator GlxA family with amidase domain
MSDSASAGTRQPERPTIDPKVRTVLDLMARNLGEPLGLQQLASAVGASPSGLRLLFLRHTGEPPGRHLKRLRLERARFLLCTEHLSIKEIGAAVGCPDESHFVRDFERSYGLSPARYRKLHFGSAFLSDSPNRQ